MVPHAVSGEIGPPSDRGGSSVRKAKMGRTSDMSPDLITGIHGDDPKKVYADLCEMVEDVILHFESEGRTLPRPE
jgi:hypothetical protein